MNGLEGISIIMVPSFSFFLPLCFTTITTIVFHFTPYFSILPSFTPFLALLLFFKFVLVFSGVEIIFFIVAVMGLHFRFMLETLLIAQGCFNYCGAGFVQCKGLFCFTPHVTSE